MTLHRSPDRPDRIPPGVDATLFQREPGAPWIASAHTDGALLLPGLDITLPLADLYRGLTFST